MFPNTHSPELPGLVLGTSSPTSPLPQRQLTLGKGLCFRVGRPGNKKWPAPPLSCVTWGELLDLSEPQVPHL